MDPNVYLLWCIAAVPRCYVTLWLVWFLRCASYYSFHASLRLFYILFQDISAMATTDFLSGHPGHL